MLAFHDSFNAACKAHNTVHQPHQIMYCMQHKLLSLGRQYFVPNGVKVRDERPEQSSLDFLRCKSVASLSLGCRELLLHACNLPVWNVAAQGRCNRCSRHHSIGLHGIALCTCSMQVSMAQNYLKWFICCVCECHSVRARKHCGLSENLDTLRPLAMLSHSSAPPVARTSLKKLVIASKPCLFTKSETSVSFGPSSMSL